MITITADNLTTNKVAIVESNILPLVDRSFRLENYPLFSVYPETIDRIRPANEFLNTLNSGEKELLVGIFSRAKQTLSYFQDGDEHVFSHAVGIIGSDIALVFGKLGLSQRILNYVTYNQQMIIPYIVNHLSDSQQVPEGASLTRSDWHQLIAVSIITKIFFPILSEMLGRAGEDNIYHVVRIFDSLMIRDFADIISTLRYYISAVVLKTVNEDPAINIGMDEIPRLSIMCFSIILVKGFVYADLYRENEGLFQTIEEWLPQIILSENV